MEWLLKYFTSSFQQWIPIFREYVIGFCFVLHVATRAAAVVPLLFTKIFITDSICAYSVISWKMSIICTTIFVCIVATETLASTRNISTMICCINLLVCKQNKTKRNKTHIKRNDVTIGRFDVFAKVDHVERSQQQPSHFCIEILRATCVVLNVLLPCVCAFGMLPLNINKVIHTIHRFAHTASLREQ